MFSSRAKGLRKGFAFTATNTNSGCPTVLDTNSQLEIPYKFHELLKNANNYVCEFHFFVLFFIRAIFKLYICIPTNCTQLIYFINNTLKHMYCLKL